MEKSFLPLKATNGKIERWMGYFSLVVGPEGLMTEYVDWKWMVVDGRPGCADSKRRL